MSNAVAIAHAGNRIICYWLTNKIGNNQSRLTQNAFQRLSFYDKPAQIAACSYKDPGLGIFDHINTDHGRNT